MGEQKIVPYLHHDPRPFRQRPWSMGGSLQQLLWRHDERTRFLQRALYSSPLASCFGITKKSAFLFEQFRRELKKAARFPSKPTKASCLLLHFLGIRR